MCSKAMVADWRCFHVLVTIFTCTWCKSFESGQTRDVGLRRSGAVIRSAMVFSDMLRIAEGKHAAWFAGVHLSRVVCLVRCAVTSVDDMSAAGASCVRRRMATRQCKIKQRGSGCLVVTTHCI